MYTQFRKAVESQSRVRPVFPTPGSLKPLPQGLEEGAIPTAEELQGTGESSWCFSSFKKKRKKGKALCTDVPMDNPALLFFFFYKVTTCYFRTLLTLHVSYPVVSHSLLPPLSFPFDE